VSRRQARAAALSGTTRIAGGAVPVELLDVHSPVWKSDRATLAWFDRHDLTAPANIAGLLWPRRFTGGTRAWAQAHGFMDDRWGGERIDVARLRALGIQTSGISRLCALFLPGSAESTSPQPPPPPF